MKSSPADALPLILSTWWCKSREHLWEGELWRRALRTYAPGVPVLMVDQSGPIPPPWPDLERIPPDRPREAGPPNYVHFANFWASMCAGMREARRRGATRVVFIEQDLVVGVPFVNDCLIGLGFADLLLTRGLWRRAWAYTEWMAVNPQTTAELWETPFPAWDENQPEERFFCERIIPERALELGLRVGLFPHFRHRRDQPLKVTDTVAHHCTRVELEWFAQNRLGIPPFPPGIGELPHAELEICFD